jgi:hypothetical protein
MLLHDAASDRVVGTATTRAAPRSMLLPRDTMIDNSAIPYYDFDAKLLVWASLQGGPSEPITIGGHIKYGSNDFHLDPSAKYDWTSRKLVYFGPDDLHIVKITFLGF